MEFRESPCLNKMLQIPLKSNSGSITLLENGLLEIKKPEMVTLLSKACINRVQINTEGKIIIYQPNATYAVDYSLHVDKHLIPRAEVVFTTFMSSYSDNDLADIYSRLNRLSARIDEILELNPASHSSIGILQDYKADMKMISSQLVNMCNFNIQNTERIDKKFAAIHQIIKSIQDGISDDNTSPIVYEELPVEADPPASQESFQFNLITSILIVAVALLCMYTGIVCMMNCIGITSVELIEKITYVILENIGDYRYVVEGDENGTLEGL